MHTHSLAKTAHTPNTYGTSCQLYCCCVQPTISAPTFTQVLQAFCLSVGSKMMLLNLLDAGGRTTLVSFISMPFSRGIQWGKQQFYFEVTAIGRGTNHTTRFGHAAQSTKLISFNRPSTLRTRSLQQFRLETCPAVEPRGHRQRLTAVAGKVTANFLISAGIAAFTCTAA